MINFSFSEHGDLGELLVDAGDVLVHPGRHARELAGLGPDHLDELGDLAVRDLAELGQRPHAREELQYVSGLLWEGRQRQSGRQ